MLTVKPDKLSNFILHIYAEVICILSAARQARQAQWTPLTTQGTVGDMDLASQCKRMYKVVT